MTDKPKSRKCVYCLKQSDDLTWDHVFPKSWYPDNTDPVQEKWKVPSCFKCNNDFSKLEEKVRLYLGLCLDPNSEEAQGIAQKVLRSLDSRQGKNAKDTTIRGLKREQIVKQLMILKDIPEEGIMPNFGNIWQTDSKNLVTIKISEQDLVRMGEKFIKAITYIHDQTYITRDFEIDIIHAFEEKITEYLDIMERYGSILLDIPGIRVIRAKASDAENAAMFIIAIWGKWKIYGGVLPKAES